MSNNEVDPSWWYCTYLHIFCDVAWVYLESMKIEILGLTIRNKKEGIA